MQDSIEIILQDDSNEMRYCSNEIMIEHLKERGFDISVSSVRTYLQDMDVKTSTQHLKPSLTDTQKLARINWVLPKVDEEDDSKWEPQLREMTGPPITSHTFRK